MPFSDTFMSKNSPTYDAFPPGSLATWQQQAEQESKGRDSSLDAFELEGLSINPFYTSENFPPSSALPITSGSWQYHAHVAGATDEEAIRRILRLGADGVIVRDPSPERWKQLLEKLEKSGGAPITHLSLACQTLAPYLDTYQRYEQALANQRHTLTGTLYCHPLEQWYQNKTEYQPILESLGTYLKQHDASSAIRALAINGAVFFEEGMNVVDELSYTLSLLVAYYDQLTDQGVSAATLWDHTEVTLAIGSDHYVDLAKFRAIRLLLAQVADAYQINKEPPISIRAVSGVRNKTLYDANSNLLRNTTEAMAALLGGANVITLLPHNALHPTTADFGERMAINVVNILRQEAHLEKVADPAAGSYFLENLTQQLVEKAWAKFLVIEDQGGFIAAVSSGQIRQTGITAWEARAEQVRHQQKVLIGANKYVLADEQITFALEEPLPPRLAWEVEQVRYQVDQQVAQGKNRPHWHIFLQPQSPSATVRGKFITQLLPLGGVTFDRQVWSGTYSKELSTGVIFCGDDDFYQEIRDAPSPNSYPQWMVGPPPNEAASTEQFISPQQDIVTLLNQLLQPWYDEA